MFCHLLTSQKYLLFSRKSCFGRAEVRQWTEYNEWSKVLTGEAVRVQARVLAVMNDNKSSIDKLMINCFLGERQARELSGGARMLLLRLWNGHYSCWFAWPWDCCHSRPGMFPVDMKAAWTNWLVTMWMSLRKSTEVKAHQGLAKGKSSDEKRKGGSISLLFIREEVTKG